ncbi:hypothetical protein ACWIGM_28590 [Bosea sp. NPDC055332]
MAGQAASRTVPFGSGYEPQRRVDHVIQIKAPISRALDDRPFPPGQTTSLTAPEDEQP